MKQTTSGRKAHWTAESLRTTKKFPLSLELLERVHPESEEKVERRHRTRNLGRGKKTVTNQHARPQIVSPDLCGMSYLEQELVDSTCTLTMRSVR